MELPPEQNETGLVLSTEVLEHFSKIDPILPRLITEASLMRERHDFQFAVTALLCGTILAVVTIGGFIYLVMNDRPTSAATLLATGIGTLVWGYLRIRYRTMLSDPDRKKVATQQEQEQG